MNGYFTAYTEDLPGLLGRLLIALGIGFLVGLEREYAKRVVEKEEQFAGLRTYTFIALFGFLSALLAERYGNWVFILALVGFVGMVAASYIMTARAGSYGITTELSGIITFLLGALVFNGHILFTSIVTVIVTLLLSFKLPLHRFVTSLTPQEIRAFIQFIIISGLVLPFLPEENFGPDGVWNLGNIWTMVILVSGISLVGYLLSKFMGARKGLLWAGVVGGLVSSTAVTLSMARRSHALKGSAPVVASVSILGATAILYPRILLETWIVNSSLALQLSLPVAGVTVIGFAVAFLILRRGGKTPAEEVALMNPLNFRVAVQFALVYMVVVWLIAFASDHYRTQGLYVTSVLFGAADMDAITLSVARRQLVPHEAAIAILLATLSNTVVKYVIVLLVGDRSLRKPVGIGFAAMFLAGIAGIAMVRFLSGGS